MQEFVTHYTAIEKASLEVQVVLLPLQKCIIIAVSCWKDASSLSFNFLKVCKILGLLSGMRILTLVVELDVKFRIALLRIPVDHVASANIFWCLAHSVSSGFSKSLKLGRSVYLYSKDKTTTAVSTASWGT